MSDHSEHVHSDIRRHGIRVARLVEDVGLSIILLATLVAGGIEIRHMWVQQNVMLTDLLLMFIYVETVTKVYWESGKLPVRMPLYIAIVAIARYLIIDVKDMDATRIIAVAASILVIAIAVLIVRYGHVKLPYPASGDGDRSTD
jgi:protein PsiE